MSHASIPIALAHPLHPKLGDKTYIFCIDSRHSYPIYRHHSVNERRKKMIKKMRLINSIECDKNFINKSSNDFLNWCKLLNQHLIKLMLLLITRLFTHRYFPVGKLFN